MPPASPHRADPAFRSAPSSKARAIEQGSDGELPDGPMLARFRRALQAVAPHDGEFELRFPGLFAIRRSRPSGDAIRATYRPALCVVAQGAKVVMLGSEIHEYDEHRMLVFSVDLPLGGIVIRATPAEPLLSCTLLLEPGRIAELALKLRCSEDPRVDPMPALCVAPATRPIVDAMTRLVESMSQPEEAEVLGRIVVDEILVRLLRSPLGARVAQIGQPTSNAARVARAITKIQEVFAGPIAIESLAKLVHMSVSAFHHHFKAVTGMSPLQYQKVVRLQEARRLMLAESLNAASAARRVGYLSPSQFSRDYSRLFGRAPSRDISFLRHSDLRYV